MTDSTATVLRRAAEQYLDALGDCATDESTFLILDECARQRGLTLRAEQRGVFGTVLTLAPLEVA